MCGAIYFVNVGFFRMYYLDADGHEINCRFAGPAGFLTDYQGFVTQQPARSSWQALQAAEVLVLPYELVQRLYRESSAWTQLHRQMSHAASGAIDEHGLALEGQRAMPGLE